MTYTEIDRTVSDAKQANEELFIRDENGKVFNNQTSLLNTGEENSFELDLASNLSSSTELEADVKHEEKSNTQIEKLTKTNPIFRLKNPVCHDYRDHRRNAELGRNTGSNRPGDKQPQLTQIADNKQTSRAGRHRP